MSPSSRALPWVLGSVLCVVIGDGFTLSWAKTGKWSHAFWAGVFLALGCGGYFPAIRIGGLSWAAPIGAALTTLGAVGMGVWQGETLDPQRWIGVILAIVAVALLS